MIELKFSKPSQIGEVKIVLRIIGKLLYFKFSHSKEAEAMIRNLATKGIKFRKSPEWLEVDIFGDVEVAKLGDYEIDLTSEKPDVIQQKLADFYTIQYVKSGFSIES